MTELCELAIKYGTDKVAHNYTPHYHDFFKDQKNEVKKVLEIGIGGPLSMQHVEQYEPGASLRMWEEYFPNAEIYALDVFPELLINKGRIRSFLCNQSYEESLRGVIPQLGKDFDLIVDDGSHQPHDQVLTAKMFVPLLATNGIYVIEDIWVAPGPTESWSVLNPDEIPYKSEVRHCSGKNNGDSLLIIKA